MNKQGFIEFNTRFSPEKTVKVESYARTIRILEEALLHQNTIDLYGPLYDFSDDQE